MLERNYRNFCIMGLGADEKYADSHIKTLKNKKVQDEARKMAI